MNTTTTRRTRLGVATIALVGTAALAAGCSTPGGSMADQIQPAAHTAAPSTMSTAASTAAAPTVKASAPSGAELTPLFVSDSASSVVDEYPAGVGVRVPVPVALSGVAQPAALAADAAGDLFVVDLNVAVSIMELTPAGTQRTLKTSAVAPLAIAVDTEGNLYVADPATSRVLKIVTSTGQETVLAAGAGFSKPSGVAVDAAGDVYVADTGNNHIVRVTPAGTFSQVVTPALNAPAGVAVGPGGDLYIADTGNDRVIHIPSAGLPTGVGANLDEPTAVAVDNAGNVVIINQGSNNTSVVEVTPTLTQTTLSTHYSTGIAFQPVPAAPAR